MTETTREQKLRRLARRQGVALQKSRIGTYPNGGEYFIFDPERNVLLTSEWGMHLDEVEDWLTADAEQST